MADDDRLITALEKTLDKHDARLTRIERVMWLALGVASASGIPELAQLIGGA